MSSILPSPEIDHWPGGGGLKNWLTLSPVPEKAGWPPLRSGSRRSVQSPSALTWKLTLSWTTSGRAPRYWPVAATGDLDTASWQIVDDRFDCGWCRDRRMGWRADGLAATRQQHEAGAHDL